jgi:hypothetical protein
MNTIIRVRKRRSFTVIDRRALEDTRLSWAGRGVLGYLLCKPDDWHINVGDLRKKGNLGRDAIYRILRELQKHGYLERQQVRDAFGRHSEMIYIVHEVPNSPRPENPEAVQPETGSPDTAKPTLPITQPTKYTINQVTTTTHGSESKLEKVPGSSGELALDFPATFCDTEIEEARTKLKGITRELAQQLLDELAGRIETGSIRVAPLAYLRGLVTRARADEFTPEAALQVADKRKRRRQTEAALRQAEATHRDKLRDKGPLVSHIQDNPLVRRLEAIRSTARRRREKDE